MKNIFSVMQNDGKNLHTAPDRTCYRTVQNTHTSYINNIIYKTHLKPTKKKARMEYTKKTSPPVCVSVDEPFFFAEFYNKICSILFNKRRRHRYKKSPHCIIHRYLCAENYTFTYACTKASLQARARWTFFFIASLEVRRFYFSSFKSFVSYGPRARV